ncbi:MAG TPA: hypothetical protein VK892_16680 [Pyrinomonadaceae bacterium]|nr:hypothetical protein [Pyrinomonadaceae bacterium]
MKIITTLVFCLIFSAFAFGQDKAQVNQTAKPKTELELFQEKYGTVIVKSYSKISQIRGIGGTFQIMAMEFRNPSNNTKVNGLVVEINTTDRYANSARSFIEYDEIDSLIKGINYVSKVDKSVTSLDSFEARYKTKGDFEVVVFNDEQGKLGVALSVGSIGQKTIYLEMDGLNNLVTQLQQAKNTLNTVK